MPETVPSPESDDPTTRIIHEVTKTMHADGSSGVPASPNSPGNPTASAGTSRRAHVEKQVGYLLNTTSAEEAYGIIDAAFTPPPNAEGEALATWHYHAERTRRQMVAAAIGELSARTTVQRLSQHLDTHDSAVITSTVRHPVRSPSLENFAASMDHWFSDTVHETIRTDETAKALIEAGNRRYPRFREAVIDWVEHRKRRDPNFEWFIPPWDANMASDIDRSYLINTANETLNQFLVFGLDAFKTGDSPVELANKRIHQFPNFTSTVHQVSIPALRPFATYDPDNGINEELKGKATIQTMYSAWERDPTPENAKAFLDLAASSSVKTNLTRTASLPGAGADGRARNPGHCHIDMRIVNEKAFPVSPRELLQRLGQTSLAGLEYLSMSALVAGVGLNAATHTIYSHWPQPARS